MRANVSVGTAGETILEHGFEQKIAEPRHAGPTPSSQALRAADDNRRAQQKEIEHRATSELLKNRKQNSNLKEESTMKANASSKLSKGLCRAAIAIAAIGIAAASSVHAKPNSDKPANVVAHVQLSGGPVTRMLLVKKDDKEYLLVGLDSPASVAVFDVSNPGQPRTIEMTSGVAGTPTAEVKFVADTLTLFGGSDAGTASSSSSKEMRSFSGVTASMKDKARGLIYVTNGDGLWIVKTKQKGEEEAIADSYGG
jgi:hypothetical protein